MQVSTAVDPVSLIKKDVSNTFKDLNISFKIIDGLAARAAEKGMKIDPGEKVNVDVKVTGTFTDPKIGLDMKSSSENAIKEVKKQVEEKIKKEVEKKKEEVKEKIEKEKEKAKEKQIISRQSPVNCQQLANIK